TIIVRPARAGEVLKTLDNLERKLTPEMLVIADTSGPIALAGVMGGLDTEVTATTTNILLESANFDFVSIRRTMKALNLPSEASVRFSKGIHPETVRPAAERAAELMRQNGGATVGQGLVDCYPAPLPPQTIALTMAEERLRDVLVNCGLQEVITYALTEPERDAPVGLGEGKYVELLNPISSERRVMRHSVLGGVLEVAVANLRHTDDVRLFEIGSVYL